MSRTLLHFCWTSFVETAVSSPQAPFPHAPPLWVVKFFCFARERTKIYQHNKHKVYRSVNLMSRTTNYPGLSIRFWYFGDVITVPLFNLTRHLLVLVDKHLLILIIYLSLILPPIHVYYFLSTVCQPFHCKKLQPAVKNRRCYLLLIDFPFVLRRKL